MKNPISSIKQFFKHTRLIIEAIRQDQLQMMQSRWTCTPEEIRYRKDMIILLKDMQLDMNKIILEQSKIELDLALLLSASGYQKITITEEPDEKIDIC